MVWISVSLSCIYVPRMKKLDSALAERALKMVNNASIYPIIMVREPHVYMFRYDNYIIPHNHHTYNNTPHP